MKVRLLWCFFLVEIVSVYTSAFSFGQTIAGGTAHSLVVCSSGAIKSWGANNWGQLGDGTTLSGGCACSSNPITTSGLSNIIAVAGGGNHSLALKSDSTLWAWGKNFTGEVGDGTTSATKNNPVQVAGLSNIIAIAAGGFYSLAVQTNGTVWAWGYNAFGQLVYVVKLS